MQLFCYLCDFTKFETFPEVSFSRSFYAVYFCDLIFIFN